jgi:hypothetical protein
MGGVGMWTAGAASFDVAIMAELWGAVPTSRG